MKQFVGMYAVGEDCKTASIISSNIDIPPLSSVYLNSLYCTEKFVVSPMLVMPLLPGVKGLYIGIISEDRAREVKVIPLLGSNEELMEQILSPEVLQQCINTMGVLFGMEGQPEEGEATPAYVDQDQS